MYKNHRILAIVPARAGSKGVPHKNLRKLDGISLIGRAGQCLSALPWIDWQIISTDAEDYAAEGQLYGLEAPFLRPESLSGDKATAVDTVLHALEHCERARNTTYDVILIVEPTSPFRTPQDISEALDLLIEGDFDSVITVSPIDTKYHPAKVLTMASDKLDFYESRGAAIAYRQALETLYFRNGICYALKRDAFMAHKMIFMPKTTGLVTTHEVANIDSESDFLWAEFLMKHQ